MKNFIFMFLRFTYIINGKYEFCYNRAFKNIQSSGGTKNLDEWLAALSTDRACSYLSVNLGPGTGHFVVSSDPVVERLSGLVPINLPTDRDISLKASIRHFPSSLLAGWHQREEKVQHSKWSVHPSIHYLYCWSLEGHGELEPIPAGFGREAGVNHRAKWSEMN